MKTYVIFIHHLKNQAGGLGASSFILLRLEA